MRELLTRTGDYGCAAAERLRPSAPPLHARVLYLCSGAARGVVLRARGELGTEVRRSGRGSRCVACRPAHTWSMRPGPAPGSPAGGTPL